VEFFHRQEIKGRRDEIEAVCEMYGYHPLCLSLLVGLINEDHEHRGDIVVARNLDIFGDIKAKRDHVLKRAYESLAPERRDLLSKISCFRGSMEYAVLKKVFPSPDLDKALLDLRKRGLLQYAGKTQRYDMHPIVRHYAYDHFTDEKRRKEAHVGLAKYFNDNMPATNTKVKTLEDLAPVIELYHHMVRAGNLDEAEKLFYDRIEQPTYFQFGVYQLRIELLRALFLDGEDKPPRLTKEDTQGFTLNALANSYSLSGQPRRAVPVFQNAVLLAEKIMGNKQNVAIGLGNVAQIQLVIGALMEAERNSRHLIEICQEIGSLWEADGHRSLGRINSVMGNYLIAEQEFMKSIALLDENTQSSMALSTTWANRGEASLKANKVSLAIEILHKSLEYADKWARKQYPMVVDYVWAHWLLGAAYRANNDLTLAEENLSKALNLCRQINLVEVEADILLDVARLRYAQGDFKDAQEKASDALVITERCGYVLQGADVNLFIAQYTLEQEQDKVKAKEYAEEAKKLATCDGPPYYYKVAYDEAVAMLASLP